MAAEIKLAHGFVILSLLAVLAACGPNQTLGLNRLDTVSEAEKENQAWFDEFYGRPPCEYYCY